MAPRKYNKYILKKDCCIGFTRNGKMFIFDLNDFYLIKDYCWIFHKNRNNGYIEAGDIKNHEKNVKMHRLIMNATTKDEKIDHINRNTIDNRKINLRIVSELENNHNRGEKKNNKTGRNGVSYRKDNKKYRVRITVNYKEINIGHYDKLEDAILARKEAENKYYGDYSRID